MGSGLEHATLAAAPVWGARDRFQDARGLASRLDFIPLLLSADYLTRLFAMFTRMGRELGNQVGQAGHGHETGILKILL